MCPGYLDHRFIGPIAYLGLYSKNSIQIRSSELWIIDPAGFSVQIALALMCPSYLDHGLSDQQLIWDQTRRLETYFIFLNIG